MTFVVQSLCIYTNLYGSESVNGKVVQCEFSVSESGLRSYQ